MSISKKELARREKFVFGEELDNVPSRDSWQWKFYKHIDKENLSERELKQLKEAYEKAESMVNDQLRSMGLDPSDLS